MPKCSKCDNHVTEESVKMMNGLCEDCYLEARISNKRKTHWQYIRSIKTEYLISSKVGKGITKRSIKYRG
jgi:hypothetical protein